MCCPCCRCCRCCRGVRSTHGQPALLAVAPDFDEAADVVDSDHSTSHSATGTSQQVTPLDAANSIPGERRIIKFKNFLIAFATTQPSGGVLLASDGRTVNAVDLHAPPSAPRATAPIVGATQFASAPNGAATDVYVKADDQLVRAVLGADGLALTGAPAPLTYKTGTSWHLVGATATAVVTAAPDGSIQVANRALDSVFAGRVPRPSIAAAGVAVAETTNAWVDRDAAAPTTGVCLAAVPCAIGAANVFAISEVQVHGRPQRLLPLCVCLREATTAALILTGEAAVAAGAQPWRPAHSPASHGGLAVVALFVTAHGRIVAFDVSAHVHTTPETPLPAPQLWEVRLPTGGRGVALEQRGATILVSGESGLWALTGRELAPLSEHAQVLRVPAHTVDGGCVIELAPKSLTFINF